MTKSVEKKVKQNVPKAPLRQDGFSVFCRRLAKNRTAMLGLALFMVLVLLSVFAQWIAPYDYEAISIKDKLSAPSSEHWFGTDQLGRDLLSRMLYGGRYSLSIGILSTVVAFVVGIILGAIAGFYGGWIEDVIMRFMDIMQAIPSMLIAIIISAVLGTGFFTTVVALAVPHVSGFTRMLRAQFMKIGQQEYVEAATSISCSKITIMSRHIFPNAWTPLIVTATMGVAQGVLEAASLSFIGLGIQAPTPEWGAMLSGSRDYILDYPYLCIIPGVFIMITVLGLNLLGDGVRDALDPKLKD